MSELRYTPAKTETRGAYEGLGDLDEYGERRGMRRSL